MLCSRAVPCIANFNEERLLFRNIGAVFEGVFNALQILMKKPCRYYCHHSLRHGAPGIGSGGMDGKATRNMF